MNEASSKVASEHSFFAEEQIKAEKEQNKNQIDFSKNSSNPEGIFDTLNKEICLVVENCKDLSYYSNSNSKISEQQQYNEQFLDSRYWCVRKNNSNENDSLNVKEKKNVLKKNIKNENNKKLENNFEEEKIIYLNNEDEDENDKNNFNDDIFDEDMEEKNLANRENGINEINSIKINKNSLNNKDKNCVDNTLNNLKSFAEPEDKYIILNKLKSGTPNKINQPYFPKIYNNNNQQVGSFISTFNNYPSSFGKGSFISTNNSSNNKIKKDEDHSSEEEIKINNNNINNINNINIDEIKNKNNSYYNHGNKFGPHLNNFNHLSNNIEITNLNTINNNPSFNMNNNFLYNRIPKMNLNMVYYIPVQQQPFSNNTNYINNSKVYSNLNNIIRDNNTNNNQKSKVKDIHNQNINNTQLENKINEIKTNDSSSSKDNKKKEDSINNTTNNYKNNNNYKNGSYRKNEANSNLNSNTQSNKGEKNLLNLDDIVSGKDTRTTVMIRNIPIKYTDDILIEEELKEFKGSFDCLYMPFDYEKKGNKGYAFINFVNPLHILYFHEKFSGKKWQLFESSKICELNSANFQGIYEIQKHSKNYKGYKKPLFYNDQNKNNKNENIAVPSKYLLKLKLRFPNMKYHENKVKKIIIIDSFE